MNFERFFSFTPFVIILIFFSPLYDPREFGTGLHELSGSELASAECPYSLVSERNCGKNCNSLVSATYYSSQIF